MDCVAIVAIALLGAAAGFGFGRNSTGARGHSGQVDMLLHFLQHVNERLDLSAAAAVRGVAWEVYRGDVRDQLQARLDAQPRPPAQQ